MRVLKDPEVRRAEILDAAEELFTTKGYAGTTIMDILNAIGIAKGTFYYYYKSKEEVMEAVIDRVVEQDALRARGIAADPKLSPPEKIHAVLLSQQSGPEERKGRMVEQFHKPSNAEMHQRSLAHGIRSLSPVMADIVRQGVAEGCFHTDRPAEVMEIMLAAGQVLFDEGLFDWTAEERRGRALAFVHVVELVLGAQPGSMDFLLEFLAGA